MNIKYEKKWRQIERKMKKIELNKLKSKRQLQDNEKC